jgi:predicted TIM-barrel fold metal-dependent hydrolase
MSRLWEKIYSVPHSEAISYIFCCMSELVDFHAHWFPPDYLDELERTEGAEDHRLPPMQFVRAPFVIDLEHRISLMDDAGVDVQVLAGSNPRHEDAAVHARLHEISNDALAAASARHPERFRFAASLPLPRVEAALAELDRVSSLPGYAAVSVSTHIEGAAVDDERFAPLLAALDAAGTTVLLHPDGFRARGPLDDFFMDWSIGAPFEDTIAAVRLMATGTLTRYPGIRWVVPHAGGTLPYLLERMDKLWRQFGDGMGAGGPPSDQVGALEFDSAATSSETLALAARVLGAGRFVYGTDYPFMERDGFRDAVARFREAGAVVA